MISLLSSERRARLMEQAARARGIWFNRQMALIVLIVYNLVGFADILSTHIAIGNGSAQEANPLMRAAMDHLEWERAWIAIKLALQFSVTAMILWFPHRVVVAIFSLVVITNGAIVVNNFRIAGWL